MDEARNRVGWFGQRLREVRERNGDSLRQAGLKSGLNNAYLSQLENGKIAHPSPSVLQKVATGYGLRFQDLLQWTGYVVDAGDEVRRNQAIALSTVSSLGDPSDEELAALKAIVDVLRSNRSAPYSAPSDMPLDGEAVAEIRRISLALLREADGLGRRPTPLNDVREAARLALAGELALDARDRARLHERFGKWVNVAWKRLQGTLDFRAAEIWVAPDLHEMKRRFVISHEIGHAILPAHAQTFAYIDDFTRLPPLARDLFEREANQAAVEILFQGDQGTDEFDSSPPSLDAVCRISTAFGASIVATARYAAETSRRAVAVAIAHHGSRGLGPTHLYSSRRFESSFGWQTHGVPQGRVDTAVQAAHTRGVDSWLVQDLRGEPRVVRTEAMDTGYAAIVMMIPESRVRAATRRLVPRPRHTPRPQA